MLFGSREGGDTHTSWGGNEIRIGEGRVQVKLILVRHGETVWNREQRVQGMTDIALSEYGRAQAAQLARCLMTEKIDRIVSSPLKRAYETAMIIKQFHEAVVETDRDLRELDQGDFEGLTFDELRKRHQGFLRRWIADPGPIVIPNGESLNDLQVRAWRVIEKLMRTSRNVLVVAHNFTITTILCKIQHMQLCQLREATVETASQTVVEITGSKLHITMFNDTSHLAKMRM
jgi:broad specificity phosphatase PhoE